MRQANLQDLEALIQLRLELLREAGEIKGNSDIANLAEGLWLHAPEDGKHVYEKLSFVSTSKEMEIVWY